MRSSVPPIHFFFQTFREGKNGRIQEKVRILGVRYRVVRFMLCCVGIVNCELGMIMVLLGRVGSVLGV